MKRQKMSRNVCGLCYLGEKTVFALFSSVFYKRELDRSHSNNASGILLISYACARTFIAHVRPYLRKNPGKPY